MLAVLYSWRYAELRETLSPSQTSIMASPASLGDPPKAVDVLLVVGNDKMAEARDLVQGFRTLYQMISVKGCLQIHVLGQS